MLTFSLPFAGDAAGASRADAFAPNANFIRIATEPGRSPLIMLYVEMGQEHRHVRHPDVDRGRAGDRPRAGASTQMSTSSARRETLRQSAAGGAGHRLHDRTRSAGRGCRCARPVRSREPCWWRRRPSAGVSDPANLPRAAQQCCIRHRGRRLTYGKLRRRMLAGMPVPDKVVSLEGRKGFQADRHTGEAARPARESQRNSGLRHRRPPTGREVCDIGAIAGAWRSRQAR